MSLSDEIRNFDSCASDYIREDWAARIEELEAENRALRAALQDIADDPVISEPLGMKRGVSHMLAIARNALPGNIVD